jgi:tetratricopeptide (TPR) repeat protein
MSLRRKSYSAVLAVLLLGILMTGAYALSMLIQGEAAYPVHMMGQAQLSAELIDARHIRPASTTPPAVGVMPSVLPLPPAPKYGNGTWVDNDLARRVLAKPETRLLDAARKFNEKEDWAHSLPLYESLFAAHPDAYDLALERAHVLAWAGRNERAGEALLHVAKIRQTPLLAFEAAQNYWWGGNSGAADSAIAVVLSWQPQFPGALALRQQVRMSASPSVALAREWARDGGQLEQLMYARALVNAKDYDASLTPYRRAIALGANDSIRLELAAAASAADSGTVAIGELREYLARHENATDIRITLARQYGWSEKYADALREYDVLIAQGHTELATERAQTVVWTGDLDAGALALQDVVATDSTQVEAWRLLGDVQRWRGKPKEALIAYQSAARLSPADAEIVAQIAAVQQDLRLAQRAMMPVSSAHVRVDGMSDNQGFTFVQTRADQFVATRWGGFQLSALSSLPSRDGGALGSSMSNGYGGAGSVSFRPRRGVQLDAGASAQHFSDVATFLGFNAGVTLEVLAGTTVHAGYVREPAVRRASTMLALQARTVSERIELLASGKLGTWGWSAQAEREKLASDLGNTRREAAVLAGSYGLTSSLTFDARVSALRSNAASPTLPGFGALYWSPEHYIEPSAGLSYKTKAAKGLTVGAGVTRGYAFAKERPGPGARFTQGTLPTFALNGNAAYQRGAWGVMLDVGYGGALHRGYRSFNSALGITYTLPR